MFLEVSINLNKTALYLLFYFPYCYKILKKFILSCCLVNLGKGKRFYHYTAIDKYSYCRYMGVFEEHSTYSSKFLGRLLQHLTKHFSNSGKDKLICPFTPRHNGKVERSTVKIISGFMLLIRISCFLIF